ncbi:hypothetical protein E4T50_06062 [Aureobasidium sp. EXF-12298]|nr:hypothetical protein E4T50_06062 [Aureobasidium sp. EXF-12298]KAI4762838.1 hypothetical protein E4T51_04173 [Aureobasidium sp. EXF-12344]KAI4776861.1 hypothetical protein E4T52_08197 [Aureobasidium sp. EXF-3400]
MQIPTFFLRTNMRLLIFQALVAWLSIRCHNLPLPSGVGFALTSYLGSFTTTAKDILDSRYGFVLPWEATFILPIALDAYITNSMPELAILLGTSPCEVAKKDPETHMCVPEIAYRCHEFADMWAHRKQPERSLRIMEICREKYHTDVKTARKHHEMGHKHDSEVLMQLLGCLQAAETWEKKREICPENKSIVDCVAAYGAQEFVADLRRRNPHMVEEKQTPQKAAVEGEKETGTEEQLEAATEEQVEAATS